MFEDVRSRTGCKIEDSVGVKLRNSLLQVSDVEDEVEGEVEGEFEGVGVGGGESEG